MESNLGSGDISAAVRDESTGIFKDRDLLDTNRIISDDRIVGRDNQLSNLITLFKPLIQGSTPPNVLAYGPSGTGKSLIVNRVLNEYQSALDEQDEDLATIQINCEWLQTNFQACEKLAKHVSQLDNVDEKISVKGLSTHKALTKTIEAVDANYDALVVIIDEVDLLVNPLKSGASESAFSALLYQLSRMNDLVGFNDMSVVALTNQPDFMRDLDGRAESSFNPRDVHFDDYNASQLREILHKREDAFLDGVLEEDVIPLASAIAAQDHGDARKVVDLLRTAGDVAVNEGASTVAEEHVRQSQDEVEKDRVLSLAKGYSFSKKGVLLAISATQAWSKHDIELIPSPVVKKVYQNICDQVGTETKSLDSIRRYTSEFETNGLLESHRKSQGPDSGVYKSFVLNRQSGYLVDALISEEERFEDVVDEKDVVMGRINTSLDEFFSKS
ncbi:AAA family ATPase [Halobacterium sp. KA-4]|uniref:AAA family ATPase n=1 Tax=Halobacterium sp. KA-4 TaxID=2896367 RepID=UPI001E4904E5|nr:AAA family ATPase [Halobacterium sp. KA-4]MCD2200950.1 AAA family ATPase [Halobacterium sp. KA-4]